MKGITFTLFIATSIVIQFSCQQPESKPTGDTAAVSTDTTVKKKNVRNKTLSAEEQKTMTPDQAIEYLRNGNKRFLANDVTERDHSALVRSGIQGQYPVAVILSCMDSRVPVEDVFDLAAGDVFICRVAGNIVNDDILGSLEYGCNVVGAKLIVVLGHRRCGAIKSAIKDVKLGNITGLLKKIKPAIDSTSKFQGEKSATNEAYVIEVSKNNVKNMVGEVKRRSPILKQMADSGQIKIIGAGYDLHNGEVSFFE